MSEPLLHGGACCGKGPGRESAAAGLPSRGQARRGLRRRLLPAALLSAGLLLRSGGPRADEHDRKAETETFVRAAAAHLEAVGIRQALADFDNPRGGFVRGERYVFCSGLDGRVLAHGGNPALVGRNLSTIRDADGLPFAAELTRVAITQGEGWVTYRWLNPLTRRTAVKETFVLRLREDLVCSAGHYRE